MTYNNPRTGKVSVLLNVIPSIPVEITVIDAGGQASMELIGGDDASRIQIGPGENTRFDMMLRATREKSRTREIITQILPGAVFSQTARVSGDSTVIQCGGSMSIGGSRKKEGAYLRLPLGSRIAVADSGEITVLRNNWTHTLQEAAESGLLEVEI